MIGMTIFEFLTGWYFWIPFLFAVISFCLLARHEKKTKQRNQSYLNHPSKKFQKHDEWYQKKFGITS